jgi:hypothetical protein
MFLFFFPLGVILEAMNEITLDRLRREAKEKEFERKNQSARRQQIGKEKVERVKLTKAIYVEPLVSQELI